MTDTATLSADVPDKTPRQPGPALIVGIVILPMVFAWFLLRKGYSEKARALSFGWAAITLGLSQITGTQTAPEATEAAKTDASGSPEAVAAGAVSDAPPLAAANDAAKAAAGRQRQENDARAEQKYLDMLDFSLEDARKTRYIYHEDTPVASIANAISAMDADGTFYDEGRKLTLIAAARKRRENFRHEIGALQARAFPRLRVIQAKAFDDALWEHDTDVEARGADYRTLRLTGYHFAANRNIKAIMEQLQEDVNALRFRHVEFRAYKGDSITVYTLEPPADTALGTFRHGRWTLVE